MELLSGQQKGSVKDCLEQLQSISQSTASEKKRNFLLILVLRKAKVRRIWIFK